MSDRQIHVAPIPAGHRPGLDCPCEPLRGIRVDLDVELIIHRLDESPLEYALAALEEVAGAPSLRLVRSRP